MQFNPIISRTANQYFFIQNLAMWHISNKDMYNAEWQNESDAFDKKTLQSINTFKELHLKYPYESDYYLGKYFYTDKDHFNLLEKELGPEIAKKIRTIFIDIEPYFENIFKKDLPSLEYWKKEIENSKFQKHSPTLSKSLSKFYGIHPQKNSCDIYLLLSGENINSGEANNNSISLRISRADRKRHTYIHDILWHELVHLLFEKKILLPLLYKYSGQNQPLIDEVSEYINSSLLPNGLLMSESRLANNTKPKYLNYNTKSQTPISEIKKLVAQYIQENRVVDKELAVACIDIVKKFN